MLTATGFVVQPQVICSGDPVSVSWRAPNLTNADGDPVTVIMTSSPENLFVVPNQVPSGTPIGNRTVFPMTDTTFDIAIVASLVTGHKSVLVLDQGKPRSKTMTLSWGCAAVGGNPGWAMQRFVEGEFSSASVRLVQVTNTSGFPIQLSLVRSGDTGAGITRQMDVGEVVIDFNGSLNLEHFWTAAPVPPDRFVQPSCANLLPPGGDTTSPGMSGGGPMGFPAPPDITFDLSLQCGDG